MLREIYFPTIPDACALILFLLSLVPKWNGAAAKCKSLSHEEIKPHSPLHLYVVIKQAEEQDGGVAQKSTTSLC